MFWRKKQKKMSDVKERIEKIQRLIVEKSSMGNALGIEMIKMEPDSVEAKMPVDGRTKQLFGLLHGGASIALGESLASLGSCLHVDIKKQSVVGIALSASHVRSVKSGWVYGKASPLHIGRRTHVWNVDIKSEEKKLVSTIRCTVAVLSL